MASAFKEFLTWFRKPHWNRNRELSSKKRRWLVILAGLEILLILVVGHASLLLHMAEEGYMGNSSTKYNFIDSFGPPRDLSTQTTDGSWVDCFTVMAPSDRMGFFGAVVE